MTSVERRSATADLIDRATSPKPPKRRSEVRKRLEATAVAYVRVSTEEQASSGLGLEAQRAQIIAHAEANGLNIVEWFADEGISGATIGKRPAMLDALRALDAGRAGVLLGKDVSRLSRDKADLADLLRVATNDGWCLRTADGLVNTGDPQGALLLPLLSVVAELERVFISQRTSAAIRAKQARGEKWGRTTQLDPATRERIIAERAGGRTWEAISAGLNADHVSTVSGRPWNRSAVRSASLVGGRWPDTSIGP